MDDSRRGIRFYSFAAAAATPQPPRPRITQPFPPGFLQMQMQGPRRPEQPQPVRVGPSRPRLRRGVQGSYPRGDLQLKTVPKNKDPKELNMYMQNFMRIPTHLDLMQKINRDQDGRRIVLLRGAPGCGKSTFAVILSGLCRGGGAIVLSADDYFMTPQGTYQYQPALITDAHTMCRTKCEAAMKASKALIVIDNTNTQAWEMLPYVEMALEHAYEVHIVEPETPWRTNAKVLAQKTVHNVPFPKIKEMLERYEKAITLDHLLKELEKKGKKAKPDNGKSKKNEDEDFSELLDKLSLK